MKCLIFRCALPFVALSLSASVSAIGLGELHGQPVLGENLRLEITLLGSDKQNLESACFRLVEPSASADLPWLKKASFSVRNSTPPVLEIRSKTPLREPILQLALQMTCGIEVSREYVLLASPINEARSSTAELSSETHAKHSSPPVRPRTFQPRLVTAQSNEAPPPLRPRRIAKHPTKTRLPDRLMLSGGIDVGEPSLRLATELLSWKDGGGEAKEVRRDILRLEFRMLAALNEQVTTQMATAEKLRNMESTLGELQQRTADFSQRIETSGALEESSGQRVASSVIQSTPPSDATPVANPLPPPASVSIESSSGFSEWSLYGGVLGILLGLGGWLGWSNYRQGQQRVVEEDELIASSEIAVDHGREDESEGLVGVDLSVEPSPVPMPVDLDLGSAEPNVANDAAQIEKAPPVADGWPMSTGAATVDEQFEANPVMELADIMLSFGRVKGAAQALQEYIDSSPQEALLPWIRLMDVYRMAGMRKEFEMVATNLNQNFNVEIQHWDAAPSQNGGQVLDLVLEEVGDGPAAPRPTSLEDMPRIMSMVCELWLKGDVVGYLYQLLRDNRGGQRVGFALPVVEEILFLVELKETSNRIE